MITRIVNAKEGLDEAVSLIKSGELVVFPTETVYGLGANAYDAAAVKKIFEAKGRPQDNPLIVHISRVEEVRDIARDIPDVFFTLAAHFMPGALTVVLPRSERIPDIVTAGGDTVAVRMPKSPVARELISRSFPLAAPSANRSKHVSPTSARHVFDDLDGRVPLILDGGECEVGIESTVLDLTSGEPVILRPGAVTAQMLAPFLGVAPGSGKVIGTAKSPGMKYEHYAPTADAYAASSPAVAALFYDKCVKEGRRPVLLFGDGHAAELGDRERISLGESVDDFMHSVYSALRTAEKEHDVIIVETLEGEGRAASVMNRVMKAVGGKVL